MFVAYNYGVKALPVLAVLMVLFAPLVAASENPRDSLRALSDVFSEVAEQASPAVVFIEAEREVPQRLRRRQLSPFHDDFFRRFFGDRLPDMQPQQPQNPEPRYRGSHGSGFIVSADGYILTNHHVIAQADRLSVTLHDGRELPAEIVGSDEQSDLAVIRVDAQNLPILTKGRSADLRIGEWVLAIGSPFGLSHTVTTGIVSAKGRSRVGIADYEDFIQTDAAINPGNSGGPLLNLDGEVIGINTAIFSRSGGYMGIGFAIPIDMAQLIYQQLRDNGSVTRGFLGVGIQDLTAELAESFGIDIQQGVVITQVQPGSAAEAGGIVAQDVIIGLNGQEMPDAARFRNAVAMIAPGEEITLELWRDGERQELTLTMGQREEGEVAQGAGAEQLQEWGIEISEITDEQRQQFGLQANKGVVVTEVANASRAAAAGIRPGQLIVGVNRQGVSSIDEFYAALAQARESGRPVRLVLRQGNWNILAVLPL